MKLTLRVKLPFCDVNVGGMVPGPAGPAGHEEDGVTVVNVLHPKGQTRVTRAGIGHDGHGAINTPMSSVAIPSIHLRGRTNVTVFFLIFIRLQESGGAHKRKPSDRISHFRAHRRGVQHFAPLLHPKNERGGGVPLFRVN